jgi:hypothetical protein
VPTFDFNAELTPWHGQVRLGSAPETYPVSRRVNRAVDDELSLIEPLKLIYCA